MFFQSDWNSSYILGNDTQDGWGQRYFFTFYSEFGEREGAAGVEVGVLVVIFVSSILANLSIAAAVLRYREMRTVTNCFLLNLAVADSLFALGIPAVIVARISPKWQLGDIVCKLLPYSQVGLQLSSNIYHLLFYSCLSLRQGLFVIIKLKLPNRKALCTEDERFLKVAVSAFCVQFNLLCFDCTIITYSSLNSYEGRFEMLRQPKQLLSEHNYFFTRH